MPDIVYRIVAVLLFVLCVHVLRQGLARRRISSLQTDFFDWLFMPDMVASRDATPVRYWIQIGLQVVSGLACLYVAAFGWRHPNS